MKKSLVAGSTPITHGSRATPHLLVTPLPRA